MVVTLSDGRELAVDLTKISIAQYRRLFKTETAPEEEDALLAPCFGLTAEEFGALPYPDYKRATAAFFEAARNPLADPNSASASTST
ncbi:MAG: hypothetical protein WC455_14175 [Dehalococcoidia bacterium]|jgi:hypothetical protein